ncbi:MAG TPA: DUF4038 domain-containing protein [Candidatus Udaeobacter sp.]|nr:DUF4038 domain-containing protein [Candidatus Udaeobacter sp.]
MYNIKKISLSAVAIFIAVFLLLTSNESSAAASFVQQKAAAAASGASSLATTFTSSVAAGDIILVGFDYDKSQNANVASVTDSRGNTFTQIGTELTTPGGAHTRLYYAKNTTAGTDTVTVNLTAGSSFIEAYITAYRGIDNVNPIDASAGRTGNTGTVTSGNVTTTSAGDIIYGFCIGDDACTIGSGFTARSTMNSNLSEDKVAGTAGVFAATGSATRGWTMQMVALRPAAITSDTQAPTVPTNLSANAVSASQINLAWTAATDNVGVTGYKIFRDGVQIATTAATSFSNTGLTPSTDYSYTVAAFDAAGNTSALSISANATTQALPITITVSPSSKTLITNSTQTFTCTVTGSTDTSCSWSIQEGSVGGLVTPTGSSSSLYTAPSVPSIYHLVASSNANPAKTSIATINVVSASSTFPFPLHVSADRRRLEDNNGQPFLIKGDSAWSLVAGLNDQDADLFLSDRQQKGFNTVLASIIEHKFVPQAPLNAFGVAPFTSPGDFSTPNEAYFAHVDNLLSMAAQKNMLVLLTPAYLGFPNTDEGWYNEVIANGTTKMRAYGQYLGNRYKNYNNLIWVIGGDREPDLALPEVEAMVQGIKDSGSNQLITIHGTRDNSQMDAYPANDSWINFNSTYTTCNTLPSRIASDYNHSGPFPTFMVEAWYENEHTTSLACLHGQEYWPTLMGADGSLFGNDPIWFFGNNPSDGNPGWSFGDGQFQGGWKTALNSQGSVGAKFAHQLFGSRPWQDLLPDSNHLTLTAGFGNISNNTFAAAARTANGGTVIVYTPSQRNLTINMTKVSGANANAWWYNPTTGAESLIGVFPTTGSRVFNPPASGDWVLVLDDNALQLASPGTGSIPAPAVVVPPDTVAPSMPTNLSGTAISSSQINLTWTASTDNVGVIGYKIFRNGVQVGTSATNNYSDTGLSPATFYSYFILSFDAAGNVSGQQFQTL